VVLTIGGYIPYLRDVLRKKTRPHSFTWFMAALAGFITYGLQVLGGGESVPGPYSRRLECV